MLSWIGGAPKVQSHGPAIGNSIVPYNGGIWARGSRALWVRGNQTRNQ